MKIDIPCRVGDTVWGICRNGGKRAAKSGDVVDIYFTDSNMIPAIRVRKVCTGNWGKDVFATEREAWEAIEREKGRLI